MRDCTSSSCVRQTKAETPAAITIFYMKGKDCSILEISGFLNLYYTCQM